MLTPGTCTHCNQIQGFKINNFGECKEICGDGLLMGENECDDSNLINGDGCSSTCKIETGYECKGTFCWEIVNPTASVTSVSKDNVLTLTFNEVVVFQNISEVEHSMKVYINGPSSPYKFQYKIYDPKSYFEGTNEITQLDVQIYDIQAPIFGFGVEKAEIWFYNLTVLKDLSNNSLSDGKIIGNLNMYEYISEGKYCDFIICS